MTRRRTARPWLAVAGVVVTAAIVAVVRRAGRATASTVVAMRSRRRRRRCRRCPVAVGAARHRPPPPGDRRPCRSARPAWRWPRRWSCRAARRRRRAAARAATLRDHPQQPAVHQPRVRRRCAGVLLAARRRHPRVQRAHPDTRRRLDRLGAAERYPHRRLAAASRGARASALWSRFAAGTRRVTAGSTTTARRRRRRRCRAAPVRVVVVHPHRARSSARLRAWSRDLGALGELVAAPDGRRDRPATSTPAVVASRPLRRAPADGGWRDAHEVLGHGLSCSWPTDGTAFGHPPFVRLDHALVDDGRRPSRHRGLRRARQRPPAASSVGHAWQRQRSCSPTCSERLSARERPAAVGDRVLLVLGHLGERPPVAVVGDEHGVVAEAASRRARRRRCVPSQTPSTASSRPSGQHDHGDGAERGAAAVGDAVELAQQLGAVVGVAWRPRRRSGPCARPGAPSSASTSARCRRPRPAARSRRRSRPP